MRVHVCEHCPEGGHQLQWVLELSAFMWKVLLSPLISVAGLPFHGGGGGISLSALPLFSHTNGYASKTQKFCKLYIFLTLPPFV